MCERGWGCVYLCERKKGRAKDREREREKKERMHLVVCFSVTSYVCAAFNFLGFCSHSCLCVYLFVS